MLAARVLAHQKPASHSPASVQPLVREAAASLEEFVKLGPNELPPCCRSALPSTTWSCPPAAGRTRYPRPAP